MENAGEQAIKMDEQDVREGLRLLRELDAAHDLYHAAENNWHRWAQQMGQLYGVPAGYSLNNVIVGWTPGAQGGDAEHGG